MHNRAQGLPMNTLVLGALALLVLIGMVTIFASGGGSIFGSLGTITSGATPSGVSQARTVCDTACSNLRLAYSTWPLDGTSKDIDAFKFEKYCKLRFDVSKEITGVIAAECYSTQVGSSCSVEGTLVKSGMGC